VSGDANEGYAMLDKLCMEGKRSVISCEWRVIKALSVASGG
jgi:hypothetical protein